MATSAQQVKPATQGGGIGKAGTAVEPAAVVYAGGSAA
ncbi:MAG: hypothetical protein ICCCNLDF_02810 [Planctomycetes bacterium]|nr:hypothetical protein [Planctomycetota bacterium]